MEDDRRSAMADATYLSDALSTASFDQQQMLYFLHGDKEQHEQHVKWEALFDTPLFDFSEDAFLTREAKVVKTAQRAFESFRIMKEKKNRDLLAAHSPVHGKGGYGVARLTTNHSGLTDHFALFTQTILSQGTPDQVRYWLPKALALEIIGTYAQTELGHGSNVRALETTATFDEAKDEVVLDMPTITAMKWWPGALGVLATHAIVYARLIVKGKDLGFHAFIVQIRDADHKPMPGVECGDVGPKMGLHGLDSGYLYLRKVRVPRTQMLAKFQQLARDGAYSRVPMKIAKIAYVTMMKARVLIARGAGLHLARNLVIAIRYNVFRRQGFVNGKLGIKGGERKLLDYTVQQSRIFPHLATAYGLFFATKYLQELLHNFDQAVKAAGKDINSIDTAMIPELHATSAGLKAFGTELAGFGVEEARKCCGGHGYHMSSGIAGNVPDYMAQNTYEGDRLPMALQTARALVGTLAGKVEATGTFAYLVQEGAPAIDDAMDLPNLVKVWENVARTAVVAAGEQLMEAADSGMSHDAAWNANHVVLIACAFAHTVMNLVKSFAEGLKLAPADAQPALTRLCLLLALTRLSEVSVAYTKLTPDEGERIDAATKALLTQIRPDAVALVECFGITDRQLASSIARKDGDVYDTVFKWAVKSPLNKPEYVAAVHRDYLEPFLNKKYLAQGNAATAKL
jgi:acyl-CoA oxidase